jgi:hypothetical protein
MMVECLLDFSDCTLALSSCLRHRDRRGDVGNVEINKTNALLDWDSNCRAGTRESSPGQGRWR